MNETQNPPTVSFSATYRNLRALFIAGFALNAILFFVPALKAKVGGFLGFGGEERTFSVLTLTREIIQAGHLGLGLFFVIIFCIAVAFVVLAIKYPRRWLFITGACYTIVWFIFALFSGSGKDTEELFLPKLLGYVASALTLSGFWVRPPAPTATIPPILERKNESPVA